uniref:Uncharacterized protein n=1 Tax=Strigamia maritima TaxID=126957 RepID=T1ILA5_STRMM
MKRCHANYSRLAAKPARSQASSHPRRPRMVRAKETWNAVARGVCEWHFNAEHQQFVSLRAEPLNYKFLRQMPSPEVASASRALLS